MIKKSLLIVTLLGVSFMSKAQDKGQISGSFIANASFYDRDSVIGTQTTQYFHQKSSSEAWFTLNYRYSGYNVTVRYDMFQNSPLLNPQEAYTAQGLAYYSISKQFDQFEITAGTFYDQFGSGIVFRAFEDKNLGLDYAIRGAKVKYAPNDSFFIKVFSGQQMNRFDIRPQVMKGFNSEKVWGIKGLTFQTGVAFLNRTLDQGTMQLLADAVNNMDPASRFTAKYNMYAGSVYNTLQFSVKNFGDISLYTEYAKKSKEAIFVTDYSTGQQILKNMDGDVMYGALSYSTGGLGINLQYKKINSFIMRTTPYATLLEGIMNYMPALSRQNAYRLPARYSISAFAQGEQGYQGELTYSLSKKSTFTANISHIQDPNGVELYREYIADYTQKFSPKLKGIFGVQSIGYDQAVYEFHPKVPIVYTVTPFMEWSVRLGKSNLASVPDSVKKKSIFKGLMPSLRFEAQYLSTRQDKGDFAYGLIEFNLAPKYSFSVSDMVNVKPLNGGSVVH